MPKNKKPTGFLVYEGPSVLDPSVPIAVIVNRVLGNATNAKTGAMAQSFIIRTDMKPNEAVKTGQDHAICGACPYGGGKGCYVSMKMVCSVYAAYQRGSYRPAAPETIGELCAALVEIGMLSGFRAGSYGDPAAAPYGVWAAMMEPVRRVGGKTSGYTHQWTEKYAYAGRTADPAFRSLLMASAHGPVDALMANAEGWRAFTTFGSAEELKSADRMVMCPASKEAGHRLTCATCGGQSACNGRKSLSDRRANIGIVVHGSNYVKGMAVEANSKAQEGAP
jgi:hypothetical protein